jgi:excisionase family DNA binding protein
MTSQRLSEAAVRGRLTIADIADLPTIDVPTAGQLLGIGRDAAYGAVARGEIPVLRLGRAMRVSVPALLAMLNGGTPPEAT